MANAYTKANVTMSLTDKMSGAIKNISRKLKGIGIASTAAGTAISASLGAAALKFADTGDKIDKLRAKTGFGAKSITEMAHAASSAGVDFDTMADSMKDMSKFSGDLAMGSSGAKETLKNLGISSKAFAAASPDGKLDMLADALQGIKDPGKRAALAMQVMGEAGYKMLPLLTQGSEGIQAMRDEANALGITMSEDAASSAAALTDAMGRLQSQLKYVVIQIGAALAPALVRISTYITPVIARIIEFVKNNKMLIVAVAAVGVGLVALGGILMGLALTISAVTAVAGILFNPMVIGIGLAAAAIAGLIAYFVDFEAVFVSVKALSDDLWSSMLVGWEGVVAAVKVGDFEAAVDMAMKSAQAAAYLVLDSMFEDWRTVTSKIVDTIRNVIKKIQGLWSKGVDWIADKIIKVGMAVGLIDEKTGKQMLIESANIGDERTERIQTNTDNIADGIINEIAKTTEEVMGEQAAMRDELVAAVPEPEPPKPPKIPEGKGPKDPPKALITDSGTTGGFSAASVLSQLGKDQVQKDQLTVQKQIAENTAELLNKPPAGMNA
jgi:hypothetical protein